MLTLKQTQSENGSVTMTRAHEIVVSNQPHRPTPLSDSSAEKRRRKEIDKTTIDAFKNIRGPFTIWDNN